MEPSKGGNLRPSFGSANALGSRPTFSRSASKRYHRIHRLFYWRSNCGCSVVCNCRFHPKLAVPLSALIPWIFGSSLWSKAHAIQKAIPQTSAINSRPAAKPLQSSSSHLTQPPRATPVRQAAIVRGCVRPIAPDYDGRRGECWIPVSLPPAGVCTGALRPSVVSPGHVPPRYALSARRPSVLKHGERSGPNPAK